MGIEAGVLALIGTGISSGLSLASGFAQKSAADANAKYYRQVAEQQRNAREIARFQTEKQNKAYRSRQLAQIGKAGVELTGTPLGLVTRTAEEQEFDLLLQDYNTEVGVSDTLARASMQEQQGSQALLGGFTRAASTAVGGINRYADLKRNSKSSKGGSGG